jgi:hypothetical protein
MILAYIIKGADNRGDTIMAVRVEKTSGPAVNDAADRTRRGPQQIIEDRNEESPSLHKPDFNVTRLLRSNGIVQKSHKSYG